jgi:hypothetical protein
MAQKFESTRAERRRMARAETKAQRKVPIHQDKCPGCGGRAEPTAAVVSADQVEFVPGKGYFLKGGSA